MKNLNVFSYGYLPWRFRNIWHNIHQFFRNLKFAYSRAKYGYCDRDLWDLDLFYTNLFIDSLRKLSTHTHTHPWDMSEDAWTDYLKEMSWHFYNSLEGNLLIKLEDYNNDTPIHINYDLEAKDLMDWRVSELHCGLDMLKERFFDLWD